MKQDKRHGNAYKAVQHTWNSTPRGSWQRLNHAMYDTLKNAIEAKMSFNEADFTDIINDFRGGYWMGDNLYNIAVKSGHTPACLSYEKWAGRPPALWAEKTRVAERLAVRSEFTWEGLTVTVTSMKTEHLVACSYKTNPDAVTWRDDLKVGQVREMDRHGRRIEDLVELESGVIILRLGPVMKAHEYERNVVDRVFKIKYDDLQAKRKEYNEARKAIIAEIEATTTVEELDAVSTRVSAGPRMYRHFDLEEIGAAWSKKRDSFDKATVKEFEEKRQAARLDKWLAGEDVGSFFAGDVRLRVKGSYIETTTGQSVSLESVKKLLPLVPRYRTHVGPPLEGYRVDLFNVEEISKFGVKIGCTLIPWPEIESLSQRLEVQ